MITMEGLIAVLSLCLTAFGLAYTILRTKFSTSATLCAIA